MTFVPIDVVIGGGLGFGILCIVYYFSVKLNLTSLIVAVLGLFLIIAGGVVAPLVARQSCRENSYEAAFAELPVEWMDFYDGLNKLESEGLQLEAIARFARTNPSRITVQQHSALVGGSGFRSRTLAMKTLENSSQVDQFVILDFVDGLCQQEAVWTTSGENELARLLEFGP